MKKAEQLFATVERGQKGNAEKVLNQGANVNCRNKTDGSTPLIEAAKRRHFVIQQMLLSNGANPNLKDNNGLTALHFVSEAGDVESMKLLIASEAHIDTRDSSGCSPMFYSVKSDKVAAVDLLSFCGADAFVKNKNGISPYSMGKSKRNEEIKQILFYADHTKEGIKNGDIYLQHVELTAGKITLDKIDLDVEASKSFSPKTLSFLCRRVRPEYSTYEEILPSEKETLISDAFEFKISTTHVQGTVEMGVTLYSYPEPHEDVYLKTDQGTTTEPIKKSSAISKIEEIKGQPKWKCRVIVDIGKVRSFVMVTLPRIEEFSVGVQGGSFVSEVDSTVQIEVQPKTLSAGEISLEVAQSPVYKQEDFEEVLSVGNFYDLINSKRAEKIHMGGVRFTMPVPEDYEGDGELCVMSGHMDTDFNFDKEEDSDTILQRWEIAERNLRPTDGTVVCSLSHFSIYVPLERRNLSSDDQTKLAVHNLLRRCMRKECFLQFFCLVRPDSGMYQAVVECTSPDKLADRIDYWLSIGFIQKSECITADIETRSGQEYELEFKENIKKVYGLPHIKLQYHSKRQNFQTFHLDVIEKEKKWSGYLMVHRKGNEKYQECKVVSIPITLEEEIPEYDYGFLDDTMLQKLAASLGKPITSFLRRIADKLGTPAWVQAFLHLGLSMQTIDKYKSKPTTPYNTVENKIYMLLREWRESSKERDDKGVPDLRSAFLKIKRKDIDEEMMNELKIWMESKADDTDPFFVWVENNMNDLRWKKTIKKEVVSPMSNDFLNLLVRSHRGASFCQVGICMDLSESQISEIIEDESVPDSGMKYVQILGLARDNIGDVAKSFKMLVNALEMCGLIKAKEWALQTAKVWCEEIPGKTSKLKTKLKRIFVELNVSGLQKNVHEEHKHTDGADDTSRKYSEMSTLSTETDEESFPPTPGLRSLTSVMFMEEDEMTYQKDFEEYQNSVFSALPSEDELYGTKSMNSLESYHDNVFIEESHASNADVRDRIIGSPKISEEEHTSYNPSYSSLLRNLEDQEGFKLPKNNTSCDNILK